MFCPKCGAQLNDGARFCNVCGNQLSGAPAPQQQYAPVPRKPAKPFRLPDLADRFVLAYTFVMFIFMFFGWFRVSGGSDTYSLFSGNMFDLSALIGIAKIVSIINVFVFAGYAFFSYVNINKTGYGLSSAFLKRLCGIIFYGAYLFSVLFTFIGALTAGESAYGYSVEYTVSAVWYFALIGGIIGFVMVLLPGLVKKFVKE